MKKTLKNMIIGAVMTAGVLGASASALAATEYVQTDMNFRSGASSSAALIGSVPAGAQVDYLNSVNDWDLITYNGTTGYIHGGNLADSYTPAPSYNSVQDYYDNNWTQTAAEMDVNDQGYWMTVQVDSGYLALRNAPTYDSSTEIGQLNTGDVVRVDGECTGSYVYVYSPKYGTSGWVNAGFLSGRKLLQ